MAEFAVNNKMYSATKVSLFIANQGKELRIGADIRKKGKAEKATKFAEIMKKFQKEVTVLRKAQEEIKCQVDRERKEVEK